METHSQVEEALLAVSAWDELLLLSSDVQISLGKSSALFSSRVTKVVDVGRCSNIRPQVRRRPKDRVKRRDRRVLKPTEDPLNGNDIINTHLV